jgi:hypothetical protein
MHIKLIMPRGGEDGVIIATLVKGEEERVVEFRGTPYSQWDIDDDSPMIRVHSSLKTANVSDFQNGVQQTITKWNAEWNTIYAMVVDAITQVHH